MNDIINTDLTNREYGQSADGIAQLSTGYEADQKVVNALNEAEKKMTKFIPKDWNCSTYSKYGINQSGANVLGVEKVTEKISAVTPNYLFKDTKRLNNATVLRDPGASINTPFASPGTSLFKDKFRNKWK